jgi:hypothetical protein
MKINKLIIINIILILSISVSGLTSITDIQTQTGEVIISNTSIVKENDYRMYLDGAFLRFSRWNTTDWDTQFSMGGSIISDGLELTQPLASVQALYADGTRTNIIRSTSTIEGVDVGDINQKVFLTSNFNINRVKSYLTVYVNDTDIYLQPLADETWTGDTLIFNWSTPSESPDGYTIDAGINFEYALNASVGSNCWQIKTFNNEEELIYINQNDGVFNTCVEAPLSANWEPTILNPNQYGKSNETVIEVWRFGNNVTLHGHTYPGLGFVPQWRATATLVNFDVIPSYEHWNSKNYSTGEVIYNEGFLYYALTDNYQNESFENNVNEWELYGFTNRINIEVNSYHLHEYLSEVEYMVDTTDTAVTIQVPRNITKSFYVRDVMDNFWIKKCYIDFLKDDGSINYTVDLDGFDNEYFFYNNGSHWKYGEVGKGEIETITPDSHTFSEDFVNYEFIQIPATGIKGHASSPASESSLGIVATLAFKDVQENLASSSFAIPTISNKDKNHSIRIGWAIDKTNCGVTWGVRYLWHKLDEDVSVGYEGEVIINSTASNVSKGYNWEEFFIDNPDQDDRVLTAEFIRYGSESFDNCTDDAHLIGAILSFEKK